MATPTRWAPWIEPRLSMTGGVLTVNAVAPVLIPGLAVTLIPHVDTRLAVEWVLDLTCTAPSAAVFVSRLLVNGVAQAAQMAKSAQAAGDWDTLAQALTVDLTGGTSYALTVDALLSAATATYQVNPPHSGMVVVAMANLHT